MNFTLFHNEKVVRKSALVKLLISALRSSWAQFTHIRMFLTTCWDLFLTAVYGTKNAGVWGGFRGGLRGVFWKFRLIISFTREQVNTMRSCIYYHRACSVRDAILVPSLKRFCVDAYFLKTEKKTPFSTISGYVWVSHSFIELFMYLFNTINLPFLGWASY